MKLPKINLTPSTWPKRKKESSPPVTIGAKAPARASQAGPSASAPSQKARPLPSAPWGMNEGKPAPSSAASEQAHEPVRSRMVHFKLFAPDARTVFLAGTFNDWDTTATQMGLDGFGAWVTDLSLPPGRYEYRFVVDGKWIDPPQAKAYVPNLQGGRNGVVEF